ncbi:hypothetical protein [Rhodopseudomonas pseudopalustris]|uniref:hypothetical protein n=1 Tax=Rhodopseudomonas pseudopalustris TaxID=1513892 RepID=UPI000B80B49F|nr:hypothetical protein [Rhodopseudomonas pseudopalustris]
MDLLASFADIAAAGASLLIAQIASRPALKTYQPDGIFYFSIGINLKSLSFFDAATEKPRKSSRSTGGVVSASSRSMPPIVDDEIGRNAFSRMMKH